MASTFAPHPFMAYPDGHHIKKSCMKCGRDQSHEIHEVPPCGHTWWESVRRPGYTAVTFGEERICVLPRGHYGDHDPILKDKIEESS